MKKILALVFIASVMCSCGNVENDVKKAYDELSLYGNQCSEKYYDMYVNIPTDDGNKFTKELKHMQDSFKIWMQKDAEEITSKVFDKLFDKYDEKEVINLLYEICDKDYYKVEPFKDKEDLYKRSVDGLMGKFCERAMIGLQIAESECKTNMIEKAISMY